MIPSRRATVKCLFSPAGPSRAVCTRVHVRQCLAAEPLPKGTEKSHDPRMARLLVPVRARVLRAHRIRSAGRLSGLLLLGRTFPQNGQPRSAQGATVPQRRPAGQEMRTPAQRPVPPRRPVAEGEKLYPCPAGKQRTAVCLSGAGPSRLWRGQSAAAAGSTETLRL